MAHIEVCSKTTNFGLSGATSDIAADYELADYPRVYENSQQTQEADHDYCSIRDYPGSLPNTRPPIAPPSTAMQDYLQPHATHWGRNQTHEQTNHTHENTINTDENTINKHEDSNDTNMGTGQEPDDACDNQGFADDAEYCDTNLITTVLIAANKEENQF